MLTIGVDAHKQVHAAVAVDAVGRSVDHWRGPNTPSGWAELLAWAQRQGPTRQWGIEGAWQYGRHLAQYLVAAGEAVVDVNPRLTAVLRRGGVERGKTDRIDAQAVARVVCRDGARLPVVAAEDGTAVLALWTQERTALSEDATRLRNRAHQYLALLTATSGQPVPDLTTAAGVAAISGWTHPDPADLLGQARAEALRRLGAQLTLVMTEVAALTRRLTTAGARHGAPLVAIYGIAGLTAAELLGLLGPGQRFASDAQLASYAGVAPLAASSGPHQRHRLNRGGQRQLNAILERIALTQGRGYAPAHAYLARRQHEGKRPREARRALKRYLARAVWQALQQCAPLPLAALADLIPGSSLGLDPPLT